MTTNKEIHEGILRRPEQYESLFTEEDLKKISELIKTFNLLKDSLADRLKSQMEPTEVTNDRTAMVQFVIFTEVFKEAGNAIMSLGAITTLEKTEIDQKLQNAGYCNVRDFLRDSMLKAILEDGDFEEYLKSKHKM